MKLEALISSPVHWLSDIKRLAEYRASSISMLSFLEQIGGSICLRLVLFCIFSSLKVYCFAMYYKYFYVSYFHNLCNCNYYIYFYHFYTHQCWCYCFSSTSIFYVTFVVGAYLYLREKEALKPHKPELFENVVLIENT